MSYYKPLFYLPNIVKQLSKEPRIVFVQIHIASTSIISMHMNVFTKVALYLLRFILIYGMLLTFVTLATYM